MAIVTYEYYSETFFGETIATEDFPKYEARAQDIIFQICRNRVTEDNFSQLSSSLQTAVMKSICAQCEYFYLYGLDIANTGLNGGGFTVGKVRVDGASSSKSTGAKSMISPLALSYLEQTGLIDPSVSVGDYMFIDVWGLR